MCSTRGCSAIAEGLLGKITVLRPLRVRSRGDMNVMTRREADTFLWEAGLPARVLPPSGGSDEHAAGDEQRDGREQVGKRRRAVALDIAAQDRAHVRSLLRHAD